MSILRKIILSILFLFFVAPSLCLAAPSTDNDNGIYTDDFANTTGISSSSNAGVNSGVIQLKNAGGAYVAPYQTSGYVITSVLRPLSISEWKSATISATIPEGTSIKVQIVDDGGSVYDDIYLENNSIGVNFPIDLSLVPPLACANFDSCSKPPGIMLKILLVTNNSSITPTIDFVTITWLTKQGDLSTQVLSTGAWPMDFGNRQLTNQSQYYNEKIYPAFKWVSTLANSYSAIDKLYVLSDKLFGSSTLEEFFALDKDNGELIWSIPGLNKGRGVITSNGTYFSTEMYYDYSKAIDTNNGVLKWGYNFYGGHGNSMFNIGNDETLYTFRSESSNVIYKLWAINQDGSVEWTKLFDNLHGSGDTSVYIQTSPIAQDGTLYMGYYTLNDTTNTGNGKLLSINPENGETNWIYPSGDIARGPLVDANGTIYIETASLGCFSFLPMCENKLLAINPNGTLKWEKSFGANTYNDSMTDMVNGGTGMILKGNNSLLLTRILEIDLLNLDLCRIPTKLYEININDGSTVKVSDEFYSFPYFDVTSHGNDGILYSYDSSINSQPNIPNVSNLVYRDKDFNIKWKLSTLYDYELEDRLFSFFSRIDERGWIYSGYYHSYKDGEGDEIEDQIYSNLFALAPWTLTSSLNASFFQPGNIMTFTVSSSMLSSNPLFGGDNQVQIVMDNGDKVPLTYSSTNGSGNSIWTGAYALPSTTSHGTHTYTVEAQQPNLQTDITTHFASASAETNNTGITTTGSFTVGTADVPRPEIPSNAPHKSSSTPPQNQVVGNSGGDITFNQEDQGMQWQIKVVLGPSTSLPSQTHVWLDKRTEADILAGNSVVGKSVSIPKSIINSAVTKIYEFDPSNYQTGLKINTLPSPVQIYLPLTKSLDSTNGMSVLRYDPNKKTWVRLNTSIVLTNDKKYAVFVTNQSGLYILSSSGGTYQFSSTNTNAGKPNAITPKAVKGVTTVQTTTTTTKPKLTPKNTRCFLWWCF